MVFLAIEQTEFWVDDELIEKFEKLAGTKDGTVSLQAQVKLVHFCEDDFDKRMQLIAWMALRLKMTGKDMAPAVVRGCDQIKVRQLISAAVKERQYREDIPRGRKILRL